MRFQEKLHEYSKAEIWEEYCRVCGKPVDGEWFPVIEKYEEEVQAKRG